MVQKRLIVLGLLSLSSPTHASFIESTMGTAVVNDATATYHNPAALTLVKKPQMIGLGNKAGFHKQFVGQSQEIGGLTQSGMSKEYTDYSLPSGYITFPVLQKVRIGLAILLDDFGSDIDEPSILRYDTSNKQIKNIDYTLGLGLSVTEDVSIGAGVTYSDAHYISHRITGFPSLEIPDSESHYKADGRNYGWNVGFLIKPFQATQIGFDYRSVVFYQFRGKSEFEGPPSIISNHFNFNFWTPARSVLTISHYITPTLGFITTAQLVQWGVFKKVTMHGLATQVGRQPLILPTSVIQYHDRNTWIFTLGGIKKITPKWTLRVAGTYSQSPGNGLYRLTSGDDYVIGASTRYQIYKNLAIDAGYAHSFTKNKPIDIATQRKRVVGINKGYRDSVSLKLTYDIV